MRSRRSAFLSAAPVATVVLLLALLSAPSARAGSIVIDFDLTGSSLSMFGGILNIPPDGMITSATARITVQGSSLTAASAGSAAIANLTLVATLAGTVGSGATLTGSFAGSQVGGGAGTLTAGLGNVIFGSLSMNLNGIVNCIGGLCGALGTFPISATNSLAALTALAPFNIGGLATLGAGTFNGVVTLALAGNNVVVNLVGQEVSRTFLPEPGSGVLIGLGLAGMLVLRVRPRRWPVR